MTEYKRDDLSSILDLRYGGEVKKGFFTSKGSTRDNLDYIAEILKNNKITTGELNSYSSIEEFMEERGGEVPTKKEESSSKKKKTKTKKKTVKGGIKDYDKFLKKFKEEEMQDAPKIKKLYSGFIKDLPLRKDSELKGIKSFCMLPSKKHKLMKDMKKNIIKKATRIEDKIDEGKDVSREEKILIRDIHTLANVVSGIPVCDPEKSTDIVKEIQKDWTPQDWDEFISGIAEKEKTEREASRDEKTRAQINKKEHEDAAEKYEEETGEDFEDLDADEQADYIKDLKKKGLLDYPAGTSDDQFLQKLHQKIYGRMLGYLYDGGKGNKPVPSPCGIDLELEKDYSSIPVAEDKLAFFGSKDDWEKFYMEGDESVESGIQEGGKPMTFHRMSPKDWPGCVKELYEYTNDLDDNLLKEKIEGKQLSVDDFVSKEDGRMKKGYTPSKEK